MSVLEPYRTINPIATYRTRLETKIGEDGMLHLAVPDTRLGERMRVVITNVAAIAAEKMADVERKERLRTAFARRADAEQNGVKFDL